MCNEASKGSFTLRRLLNLRSFRTFEHLSQPYISANPYGDQATGTCGYKNVSTTRVMTRPCGLPLTNEIRCTFGLIVGPIGSSKMGLVTDLCNKFPSGVIYFEVCEPNALYTELVKAISMKISLSNVFDLLQYLTCCSI